MAGINFASTKDQWAKSIAEHNPIRLEIRNRYCDILDRFHDIVRFKKSVTLNDVVTLKSVTTKLRVDGSTVLYNDISSNLRVHPSFKIITNCHISESYLSKCVVYKLKEVDALDSGAAPLYEVVPPLPKMTSYDVVYSPVRFEAEYLTEWKVSFRFRDALG